MADLDRLVSLLFATKRMIADRMRKEMNVELSSILQMETLRYVAENPHVPMKEIAGFLRITPPSATSLVSSLVKSGKLERVSDRSDRRLIRLRITAKGARVLEESMKKVMHHVKQQLSILNEQEIKNFISILEKLSA